MGYWLWVIGYGLLVIEFFLKGYGLVVIGYRILMVIAYGRKEIFV